MNWGRSWYNSLQTTYSQRTEWEQFTGSWTWSKSMQAGGYVDMDGNINGWLSELAFAPVDYNPQGPVDEWSGEIGCGASYFSQQ